MEKNPSFRSVARSDDATMYRDKSNTVINNQKEFDKAVQES